MKKKKAPKKSYYRNKADKAYQSLKKKRCELCGKEASCIHHIIPKARSNATRYYIPNGITLCRGCHHLWHATQDPRMFEAMKKVKGGDKWWNDLQKESRKTVRTTIGFYKSAIEDLKIKISKLVN